VIANEKAAHKAQKLGTAYDVPATAIRPRIEASKG